MLRVDFQSSDEVSDGVFYFPSFSIAEPSLRDSLELLAWLQQFNINRISIFYNRFVIVIKLSIYIGKIEKRLPVWAFAAFDRFFEALDPFL